MLLAVIPARGGSKGIPRKNLALLSGKPLIEYTIRAAQQCALIDDILVSTDDDEIAEFAVRMGLDIRYRRPRELATDTTSIVDSLEHCLKWYEDQHEILPSDTILLQPTSPLRNSTDVEHAICSYFERNAFSLVSVHQMSEHPFECVHGTGDNARYLAESQIKVSRRQDYDHSYYYINGAIYIAKTNELLVRRSFIELGKTHFFCMPRERGIDVDVPLDLIIAQALINA